MTEENKYKRPFYKPGYYPDLSNDDYHGSFGYGSTTLKILAEKTKAHLDYYLTRPKEETPALLKGQLLHTMVLEPHLVDQEFAILPVVNKRTNAGKAELAEFQMRNEGKLFVTEQQFETCESMAKKIYEHPVIGNWFDEKQNRLAEQSVYYWYNSEDWDDKNDYRIMLKVRPDLILEDHPVIFDLKTTRDASFSKFMKQARQLGYHMSAAMYIDGCNRNKELLDRVGVFSFTKFVWIVVENEPPYEATYYEISERDLKEGRQLYHSLVRKLDLYNRSDWKGYGNQDHNGFITADGRVSEFPLWGYDIV